MLNLDLTDLRNTCLNAKASAELLRSSGETAKAERVESLARIAEREIQRREREPGSSRQFEASGVSKG
ncbi:MAG: hypothetical protein ABR517_03960 [Thermoanaerobaculia bacterium]